MARRSRPLPLPAVLAVVAAAFLVWLSPGGRALAADPIVLDGEFADWAGEAHVVDAAGDGGADEFDITKFWWADNTGEAYGYWRLDRSSDRKDVVYILYVDTNNNGDFSEAGDREVVIDYKPIGQASKVGVIVRDAGTQAVISEVKDADWGLSKDEGGGSVEFRASFGDLGIVANQTIRFYVDSFSRDGFQDRVPDSGDIQWSPVNILGYALLSVFILGGGVVIWWRKGRHQWQ